MENNEKKGVPEISFAASKTQKSTSSIKESDADISTEKTAASVDTQDIKFDESEMSEAVTLEKEESPETEEKTSVKDGLMRKISEHSASLDKALYDFEQEDKDSDGRVNDEEPKPAAQKMQSTARPPKSAEKSGKKKPQSKDVKGKNNGKGKKKKKKKRRFNASIIGGLTITIVIMSISLVLSLGAITLGMEYLGINKEDKEITFNIPSGSTTEEIIDLLVQNDIVKNKTLFKAVLKLNHDPTLYPGDITLAQNLSYPDIISELSEMRESYETVTVTVTEGESLYEVATALEENGVCSAEDFLFQFNAEQDLELDSMVESSTDAYYAMEGYFFPDTYEFYVGDSAYNVTKNVRENFESKITDEMYDRMDELGMDLNEVITIASIVQNEAGTVEDMPTVASVFLNRLNNSDEFPQLQSDATKNYVENTIKKAETSTAMIEHYENCYDTYVCIGLPAGPIGNPGLDAINAVLYADETDYYYFCNDLETGECYYAETYKEHQENLEKAGLSE